MKQLRFTTTEPTGMFSMLASESPELLVEPKLKFELIPSDNIKGKSIYIHGDAEKIARFDIPYFIDGDLGQLDLPIEKQDILMLLPDGEYPCQAEFQNTELAQNSYLIILKKSVTIEI